MEGSRHWKIAGAIFVLIGIVAGSLVAQMPQASAASASSHQALAKSLIADLGMGSKEGNCGWQYNVVPKGVPGCKTKPGTVTDEWTDLVWIFNYESSWNNTAVNRNSGAYGIPQAMGHGPGGCPFPNTTTAGGKNWNTKLANPSSCGGNSSSQAQLVWGLMYIRDRYYDPAGAYRHEKAYGWY